MLVTFTYRWKADIKRLVKTTGVTGIRKRVFQDRKLIYFYGLDLSCQADSSIVVRKWKGYSGGSQFANRQSLRRIFI